ncbi:hypothetical protein [Streptomyces sp. NPDC050738]|uniref:hypothetical protein n=1 Tax=Streptomyces sp. NPDC050738 TaxID=3154744 RepID=UPI0034371FC3
MGRIEALEGRTRDHPVASLAFGFLAVYVLIGAVITLSGAPVTHAWVAPLVAMVAVGAGIAAVRFPR